MNCFKYVCKYIISNYLINFFIVNTSTGAGGSGHLMLHEPNELQFLVTFNFQYD